MQFAAGWFGGVLLAAALPRLPAAACYVPLALTALLALRFRVARPIVWLVAGFAFTVWRADGALAERWPPELSGRDVALRGWIDAFPVHAPGQITFSLAVTEPRAARVPPRVRLTWYDPPAGLAPGDSLQVIARLRTPHGLRNPGGFDYERWLLASGHGATGYVRSGRVAASNGTNVARTWLRFRARIASRLAALAPDADSAALLVALALGERDRFEERHWTDFRRTGTSHLVAVSGAHVGLLGLIVFVLLRRAWLRLPQPLAAFDLEAAAAGSALATAYYAALTGFAVPAQRSLLMILVALALVVSRRPVGRFAGLAAALAAVLVYDPFAPLEASFWLSFAAVATLLAIAAPRDVRQRSSRLARAGRAARALLALQWTIGLALLPLTAAFFGEISIVGPAVNLVAIPLFGFVLVPLTLAAALAVSSGTLAATLGPPLVHSVGLLASATVAGLHTAASWSWASWPVGVPPAAALAVAAVGVALALPTHPLPGRRLAWLALTPALVPAMALPPPGTARLTVLDVGQGLAVIVETRGHRLVYDAGPAFPSGFDSGADVVLPALAAGGRRGLDALVVSHADNDHAGGAPALLAAFPRAAVFKGPDVRGLPGRVCERGQEWLWDGVRFAMLHPPRSFAALGNESSCVLEIDALGGSALLAGDIEARGEAAVLAAAPPRTAVVVVPHHGSATSSSASFVSAIGARIAIASAGFENRWGFPKRAVRERWERAGARLIVTADSGAVTVTLGAVGPPRITTERDARHHYWEARATAPR